MKTFLTLATSVLLAVSFTATAADAKSKKTSAVDYAQACRDQYKGQYANGHNDNLVMIARCRAAHGDISNRR
jgi:hypothetical protein